MYHEWIFYMFRKNHVLSSRYLDFCVFDESANIKIYGAIFDLHSRCYTLDCLLGS